MTRMSRFQLLAVVCAAGALHSLATSAAPSEPRARDLGVPFDGTPGPYNAITDVPGIEVGFKTLIRGSGKLVVGQGPVRTGVTAVFPGDTRIRAASWPGTSPATAMAT